VISGPEAKNTGQQRPAAKKDEPWQEPEEYLMSVMRDIRALDNLTAAYTRYIITSAAILRILMRVKK